MKPACYPLIVTVALAAAASGQTDDKASVDPASWVPGDALAYVGVSDVKRLIDEFQATPFYKMTRELDAKQLPGQISLPLKIFDGLKEHLAKALDTEPDKLKNPFAGPMTLCLLASGGQPADDVKVVFVAGVGDGQLMKTYYDQAIRRIHEQADDHEKVAFGAYTFDRFTKEPAEEEEEDEEEPEELDIEFPGTTEEDMGAALEEFVGRLFSPEALPEQLVLCLTEDRLIVAPSTEHIRDVLRRERVGESLLETELYQTLRREFKPLGSVRFLINLAGVFEMIEAVEGEEAREALTLLGARGMRGLIGHVLFDNREFQSKSELLLLLSGERTGLAKIFSMENRAVAPPVNVSADNLVYASFNADVTEIIDEVERMVRRADPQAADQMRASMESIPLPDGQTLNLRKEVLENLCGPLTFAMAFQRPYGPQSMRLRLTLGHRDKEQMARFLEKFRNLLPGMMTERELRGTLGYDILGGFTLAPADDAVIFGTSDAVDAAFQKPAPEESLAADEAFKRAAALVPPAAWCLVYVDSRRMFEAALEMAKNKDALMATQLTNLTNMLALQIVEGLTAGIAEDQLDAAQPISKYLAQTIFTVATTPEGVRLTQIELMPAESD